jgi:hypothetical protein
MNRLVRALFAGAIAIALNTLALVAADLVPLATAYGGLLRLLVISSDGYLRPPAGAAFQNAFHVVVGLLMALLYAYTLEARMTGPAWLRGALYALAVWILNAGAVLPLIGEGFAGSRSLSIFGMAWFAAADTLFFMTLAILYSRFRAQTSRQPRRAASSSCRPEESPPKHQSGSNNSSLSCPHHHFQIITTPMPPRKQTA